MFNNRFYELGTQRSVIREIAEYGRQRAAVVGPENIFDYSIGNPSVPAPKQIHETLLDILENMDPVAVHSYTGAPGEYAARKAIGKWH